MPNAKLCQLPAKLNGHDPYPLFQGRPEVSTDLTS